MRMKQKAALAALTLLAVSPAMAQAANSALLLSVASSIDGGAADSPSGDGPKGHTGTIALAVAGVGALIAGAIALGSKGNGSKPASA